MSCTGCRTPSAGGRDRPPDLQSRAIRDEGGVFPVAGCDEAGRGPLAGPVVAAAVILDPKRIPRGLNDSKKLERRNARGAVREDLLHRAGRGRDRAARAHRERQYPRRLALGAGARREGAAGRAEARVRRRHRPHRCRLRMPRGGQRRRAGGLDRGRLDRRQGHARPADGLRRRRASGLRLRAPHGLFGAGAFRGAQPPRPLRAPPPQVRAGRGAARPARGRRGN